MNMNLQLFAGGFVFTFTNNTDYTLKATYQGLFTEEYAYINPKSSIDITSYSEGGKISIDNEKIVSALILPMLDYTIHDGYIDMKNWGANTKVNKVTLEEKLIINFDSNISKVVFHTGVDYRWETSGNSQTLTGLEKNKAYQFTVTTKNDYIIDTVSGTLSQGVLNDVYTDSYFTVATDENGFIGGSLTITSKLKSNIPENSTAFKKTDAGYIKIRAFKKTADGWVAMVKEPTFIYGVSGEGASSPTLTRTDNAVGLTYNVGTSEITSDFDNCYPWSDMTEYTDSMGNKFIKVPKFYTQYTFDNNGLKTTRICRKKIDNTWVLNPIFTDGNGNELDYFCIGKYLAGKNNSSASYSDTKLTSVSGVSPFVNKIRADFRYFARNNGTGYQQLDIWAVTALQDLFKIEFATIDSQSIMKGYTDGSATITSGRTDLVATASGSPISNTSGKYAMKYRGIEDFYGNVHQWVDGINLNNYYSYICYNPANYKDDTGINYTMVSYRNAFKDGYITKLGYDEANPFVHLPIVVDGSDTTYYCDKYYLISGWRVSCFGGSCSTGASAGAFCWSLDCSSSNVYSVIGGRLLYRPI